MKITGVKTTIYEYRMARRRGDANSPSGRSRASGCVVELTTDEGLTGVALGGGGARPQINGLVNGLLMGEDPRHVTGLWQRMVERYFKGGHDGIANDAISVLDQALWDLKAKANDEPLWKTLGATNRKVLSYASGLDMPLSDDGIYEFYAHMAKNYGFKAGKLKVGLDQDADLRRIEKMQEGLKHATDKPHLFVDANEFWNPKQAIAKVREMERHFDIGWVEEPARRWDFLGLRRISDSIKAPVCAGENLDTLGDFLPYFHNRSADIVQVSTGMTGITCALQLADAAYGFELPVTMGGSGGYLNAHVAACLPNFMIMEVGEPEPEDGVYTTDIRFEDGYAILGDRPGTSIEIDQEALARQNVENISFGAGPSPFGRRPGAGLWDYAPTKDELAAAAADDDSFVPAHAARNTTKV
jgi:L-alanine-DL-glutamate epimerase-like enolase superfamily enzyme